MIAAKKLYGRHFVIGGAGFLGLELVKGLLEQSSIVVVIDTQFSAGASNFFQKNGVEFLIADIGVSHSLKKIHLYENDIVHHLASRLIVPNKPRFNRSQYFAHSSVKGTRNVLDWMRDSGCKKLIFWSTDMVYGHSPENPITEKSPLNPLGPYGAAKRVAEELIISDVNNNKLSATIFRPRLIIGPHRLGILEKLFYLIYRNFPVPMVGDGANKFQFVAVKDCANASILAAKKGCPNGIFNLGSNDPPSVRKLLLDTIKSVNSRSVLVGLPSSFVKSCLEVMNVFKCSPMDPEQFRIADNNTILSTKLVKTELGWCPEYDDVAMLKAAYETYRNRQAKKD